MHLLYIGVLVLVIVVLLVVGRQWRRNRKTTAFDYTEDQKGTVISCPSGRIRIKNAMYGPIDKTLIDKVSCGAIDVTDKLSRAIGDGETDFAFPGHSNTIFGDPCVWHVKHVMGEFTCHHSLF